MTFEFTPEMERFSNRLWAVTSTVGAGVCCLVLLCAVVVSQHKPSRHHLDRVSFRIVMYALAANVVFGVSSAVGGELSGPSWGCGFSVFVLQISLEFASCMLFVIALNLQLVVVHGINGQKMEKYYIMGSVFVAICLAVPPYANGEYGWDPLERDCWYTSDNQGERLAWQLGTQMIWTGLTVVGAIVSSSWVMIFMIRHHLYQKRILTMSEMSNGVQGFSVESQVLHANTYKRIIARIALYPITSCIVNAMSILAALNATINVGILSRKDYNILLLGDILYGGRAVVYALLAATDPALVRGLKSLVSCMWPTLSHHINTTLSTHSELVFAKRDMEHSPTTSNINPVVVTIELSTVQTSDLSGTHASGDHLPAKRMDGDNISDTKSRNDGVFERTELQGHTFADPTTGFDNCDIELGISGKPHSHPRDDGALPSRPESALSASTLRPFPRSRANSAADVNEISGALHPVGTEEGREGRSQIRVREGIERSSGDLMLQRWDTMRREQQNAFSRQL